MRRTGLLAGLVAALVMTLVFLALRFALGLPTPSELIADRIAPLLPLPVFFALLTVAGGFNNLKALGVVGSLLGQLAVGALGGAVYEQIVQLGTKRPAALGRLAIAVRAGLCVGGFVVVAWGFSLLLFWPLFATNYLGLPTEAARFQSLLGWLGAYASYSLSLPLAYEFLTRDALGRDMTKAAHSGRRAFTLGAFGLVLALAAGELLRRLYRVATFHYDGTQYLGSDVQPITPNDLFYVVTKNTVDPQVQAPQWRLAVGGMVERPQNYTLADLAAMPAVQQETTLMCISNEVPGGLLSNAVWQGVPLATLIAAAGSNADVVDVALHAADNYIDTIPIAKAMNATTLVAYAMNGEPLSERHGYPVRLVVPGLYGEKSVKWLTRVELLNEDVKGFYEQQGWGPNFTIFPRARIDRPGGAVSLAQSSTVSVKGVAFGGDKGVSRVEVSFDDGGTWQVATLDYTSSPLTWVLWSYAWQPSPGAYTIVARATDGAGMLQTAAVRGTAPEGATGYHRIVVQVTA